MLLMSSNRKDKDGLYPSLTTQQRAYVFLVVIYKTRTTMMQSEKSCLLVNAFIHVLSCGGSIKRQHKNKLTEDMRSSFQK